MWGDNEVFRSAMEEKTSEKDELVVREQAGVRGPISQFTNWLLPAVAVALANCACSTTRAIANLHHSAAAFARASAAAQRSANAVANRIRQKV